MRDTNKSVPPQRWLLTDHRDGGRVEAEVRVLLPNDGNDIAALQSQSQK